MSTQNIQSDIFKLNIGDTHPNGKKVESTFIKRQDFIVYQLENDRNILYRYRNETKETREAIKMLELAQREAEKKFKGTRFRDINSLAVTALREICNKEFKPESSLLEFYNFIQNEVGTKTIIARTPDFMVWISENGNVGYWHNKNVTNVNHSISEYTRIKALSNSILPSKYKKTFNARLGAALVTAFKTSPGENCKNIFTPLDDFIKNACINMARIKYILSTISASLIITLILTITYYNTSISNFKKNAIMCITCGVIGAMISIMERSNKITNPEDPIMLIVLNGTTRILLGGLFGAIAYLIIEADIAFTIFKNCKYAIATICIAAGFSERAIPELLNSITKSNN